MSRDILVTIGAAGLGDIIQARCLFADIRRVHPGFRLVVGCDPRYHDALRDHPRISALVDHRQVEPYDHAYAYDLQPPMQWACRQGSNVIDAWRWMVGIEIRNYDPLFNILPEELDLGRRITGGLPTVALCPWSSTRYRDLPHEVVQEVARALLDDGWQVVLLHDRFVPGLPHEVIQRASWSLRQLIAVHDAVDATISTDTSHLHLAGGLGKPTVGLFSSQDGREYSKYYPRVEVIQHHPVGTKNPHPVMDFTGAEILEAFRKLPC